jgi:hypothetical protein
MKLFVWEGVLRDYTAGIAFALAETSDDARKLIADSCGEYVLSELGQPPDVYDSPVGFAVYIRRRVGCCNASNQ